MNHILVAPFMIVLILSYAFMGVVFIANQRQGQAFITSVDKAFV